MTYLVQFSVLETELQNMSQLTVAEDKQSLENQAKLFSKKRNEITKEGKAMRDQYTKYNKQVIEREKELLNYIVPVEDEIKARLAKIKKEEEIESRKPALDYRKSLVKFRELTDEEILELDDKDFMAMIAKDELEDRISHFKADHQDCEFIQKSDRIIAVKVISEMIF